MTAEKKYKGVIFDLDGTLVDSAPGLAKAMNEVLEKYNFPTHSIEEYHEYIGNGIKALVEQSVPKGTSPELCEKLYAEKTELYDTYWQSETFIYPGIVDLFKELQKRGVKIGIVSSKEDYFTQKLVSNFFPDTAFIKVIGRCETIPKKPNPIGVKLIMEKVNLELKDWVLVGDKSVDLETAKNAGIDGIWASWGYQKATPTHEFVAAITSPNELLAYF